jgi:DegV family protein with EDD domain
VSGVALCTDASSLLSPVGVEVVPVPVALDGEPFEGSVDGFYGRLRAGAVATTSQPSPGDFLDVYERAAGNGSASVLSFHLDGRVSGVGASAELAAAEASVPVRVVTLPTISYGVALCVRVAHAALAGGATETNAVADATRIAATLDNVFVARSVASGRVSASAWTLLRFAEGAAQPLSSHESLDEAAHAMTRHIVEPALPGLVAVGHAGPELEVAADRLAHELVHESVAAVERYRVGPSVGAHTGPDCFGAFWWPAEL